MLKKIPYTEYEIIVDSNVSFQEFNQKYEVLEQRGDIYVVKEKDNK